MDGPESEHLGRPARDQMVAVESKATSAPAAVYRKLGI